MNKYKSFLWQRLFGCLAIICANLLTWQNAKAQLVPDSTLGSENSRLTPQGVRDLIEGGARRNGIKLGENGLFSATEPDKATLLSIQPGALFTNALRSHQTEIRNQGNLAVKF